MRFPARFPWRFGGPDRTLDIEHQAMLDRLADGWDTGPTTELWVEARADALAVTMIWAINRRVGNQRHPLKMLEALPEWEDATRLRPAPTDTLPERRRRLAAKLRGLINNAISDIEDAAIVGLGVHYDGIETVPESSVVSYAPGINPGPPGYEHASNRAHVAIRMNTIQLNDAEVRRKALALAETLDHLRPAWLTYQIGTGTSFVVGQSIIGQDYLA